MYNLTLQLNARLRPLDRGDIYEDPINAMLEEFCLGETTGGGTSVGGNNEVAYCDIEISISENTPYNLEKLELICNNIGIPKGSFLRSADFKKPIGTLEGLVLYMNGTELADEVYENYDINVVIEKIDELLDSKGAMYSYNENLNDTALYYYGDSYEEMKGSIQSFLDEYPLCQKSRVEQIA